MKRKLWMLAAILTCGLTMSSCVAEKDNPIDSGTDPDTGTTPANYDEFATLPGNEGDPAVVTALKTIENVEDLKPFINVNLGQAYYFNYRQQVDHNDPSKGTFKQQVVLTFVGKDANTILHTDGYALVGGSSHGKNHNRLDSIYAPNLLWTLSKYGMLDQFDLNCVQVEYRYHGFSLPEGLENSFKYLNAEQQSKDLHAIVTDLKKALITGSGKWLSTGVSKNGMTTAQYAYYDEMNGWNDIDVYVPYVAPIPPQAADIRIGTYMITESSKDVLPQMEKAYKKLVNDQAVADATVAAYIKAKDKLKYPDSAYLYVLRDAFDNLFGVQSYGDFDTWKKFVPTENSTPAEYANFFMLTQDDKRIYRQAASRRAPDLRADPFEMQVFVDQGNLGYDYSWFLEGSLLSDSDKQYLNRLMEDSKNSPTIDLEVKLLKNLETTAKKMIFVYGENDPWTGAAIPDPTNPNVKKYIIPYGTHTDSYISNF